MHRLFSIILLLLLTVLPIPAQADDKDLLKAFLSMLDATPDWRVQWGEVIDVEGRPVANDLVLSSEKVPLTVTATSLSVDGLAAGFPTAIVVNDLSTTYQEYTAKVSSITVQGINAAAFADWLRSAKAVSGTSPPPSISGLRMAAQMIRSLSPVADVIAINSLSFAASGKDIVTMESLTSIIDRSDAQLMSGHGGISKLVMQVDPSGGLGLALGYERLQMGFDGRFTLDRNAGRYALDGAFKIDDGCTIMTALVIDGVTNEARSAIASAYFDSLDSDDGTALVKALDKTSLSSLTFNYEDNSLARRILSMASKQGNLPTSTISQNVAQTVQFALQPFGSDLAASAREAAATFLNQPGTLSITASPDTPIPLGRLMSSRSMEIVPALKLDIKANTSRKL
ncbi:MAG: hypothetical protein U1E46_07965 [Hyphomicrobiales bacterium]